MVTATLPPQELVLRVRELLQDIPRDAAKRRVGPLCVHGMWRGKDAWLVGYEWTRVAGTPTREQVREEVLGHGPTLDAAIEMMARKVSTLC